MIDRKFFFDTVRANLFGGKLKQSQVDGMTAILDEWERAWSDCDRRWLAYMLATAKHESASTMQPIEEYGKGRGRPYGKRVKSDGTPYTDTENIFYGRGYVQLTWYDNYARAGKLLGLDLIQHPEIALSCHIAASIMFNGMVFGWFTGRKLGDYFESKKEDWVNARRIINGLDRADDIAAMAKQFRAAIRDARE